MNGFGMLSKPSAGMREAQGMDIIFRRLLKMLSHYRVNITGRYRKLCGGIVSTERLIEVSLCRSMGSRQRIMMCMPMTRTGECTLCSEVDKNF